MKLLATLLGASAAVSNSQRLLEDYVNAKDLSYIPQTEWTTVKKGGDLKFTAQVLQDDLENFVVISSADGKTWKGMHGYNFIANVREGTQIEFYNKLYEDKMKFNRISAKELEVTVKDDKGDVSYMVLALGDPMSTDFKFQVSNKVHRANVYNDDLELYYEFNDSEKPELVCRASSSGPVELTFSTGLTVKKGESEIRAEQPSSAWFASNRNTEWITCKSPFQEKKVLRFIDITDARQAGKPLMVGWNTEHTCGPIPAGTTNVRLIKGDKIKKDFVSFDITGGQQGNIKMTNNGKNVKFSGLKATPDMNTAVMCAFRDNSKLLGYTAPTKYQVFEEETPRLPVKASIDQPECGFDNTGAPQQVGTCSTIARDSGLTFPPTMLQWEITKADGTVIKYPEQPKETPELPLVLSLTPDLKDATAKCFDERYGIEGTRKENLPTGPIGFEILKKTSKITLTIKGDEIICASDAFPDISDVCSDVQEQLETDVIFCPATFMPKNATCQMKMKDNTIMKSATFSNPDCLVDQDQLPCDKSAVDDCPIKNEETAEAGGSMIWLFCFIFAAIGGGVLIMLNKKKSREYSVTDESEDPEKGVQEEKVQLQSGDA